MSHFLGNIKQAVAVCHRCNCMVAPADNVVLLESIRKGYPVRGLSRHLFPVEVNGGMVCEGSPSRAQYIENQPRDTRPQGRYLTDLEQPYRNAYAELRRLAEAQD